MRRLLKISEFAQMSGIKRKNLIYYNDIGLLTPERVTSNGYRYYTYHQLETASVITILQAVGMTLSEIKCHLDERTPTKLIELFTEKREKIGEKIRHLHRIEAMLDTRLGITRAAMKLERAGIGVHSCKKELLFMGAEIVPSADGGLDGAFEQFYELCDREKIVYGYPFGTMVSKKNLVTGEWKRPSRFFFKIPQSGGDYPRQEKPAGRYLIAYETVTYDGPEKIYERMLEYIAENKLTIAGNAYEEFLLDEIAVKGDHDYLMQVSIQVNN